MDLLPIADFATLDERSCDYNWGYDPFLYNVPEGSYVTQPIDAYKRVLELKQMIKTYHENDLRIVLDVVYNHTYYSKSSNLNRLVPNYYDSISIFSPLIGFTLTLTFGIVLNRFLPEIYNIMNGRLKIKTGGNNV